MSAGAFAGGAGPGRGRRRDEGGREVVEEGELLWEATPERVRNAHLTRYLRWLERTRGLSFEDYSGLWQWSVDSLEEFWASIWDYFGIEPGTGYERVLASRQMPGADWFPGARLNYAEHVLRGARSGETALLYCGEDMDLHAMPWDELAGSVRRVATALRALGVRPGDRVAGYLPNVPETIIAMLATTSIGAIWAVCSPDFGVQGVLDRLSQLRPRILLCTDGYSYGGRFYDRREVVSGIRSRIESLDQVIHVPARPRNGGAALPDALEWEALLQRPDPGPESFRCERVPFSHPLWILFSSGTTGLPKAIVHGHGGILLEMKKLLHFHMDLHPGERLFFFTTTGWMMWNFLASSLLAGVLPVLYDGRPDYPDAVHLWRLAEQARVGFFGTSPAFVEVMRKQGVEPGRQFDLSALRTIMPAGSPVSAECSKWFYDHVKRDLWLATGSGGTDVCTGLVGGVPTLPVYAGEIQGPSLGVAARAYNDDGEPLVNELGELVITEPMPSMPVFLWDDDDGSRYREAYFDRFPGVWRHGDAFEINARGGCFVRGRSDATLNRHGVRIGTAEIYRTLQEMPEVDDALIVDLRRPDGDSFMPLFVRLRNGHRLDDALRQRIFSTLRQAYSPRHVPDAAYAVDDIPMTISGKKLEVPVRRILQGVPAEKAVSRSAMRNPEALDWFQRYAREMHA